MLSLKYLLEEAKVSDLPIQKPRAIIREYLQVVILNALYKNPQGKHFFFRGGTAMRFFHQLPRFSEDIDFNTSSLTEHLFRQVIEETIQPALVSEGFSVSVTFASRKNLLTAELYFKEIMKRYGLMDKRGLDLMVKMEVNHPRWELTSESKVLSLYGYPVTAILMSQGDLFSEKICALLARKRGRDIYDTLFMLRRRFPINEKVLKANGVQLPIKATLTNYIRTLKESELKQLADQVRPFLFREEQADWIQQAPKYVELFLKDY